MAGNVQDRVRWGILGAGKIAGAFANGVTSAPNATLSAVASRSLEKARSFADGYGAPDVHGSYEEVLVNPNVDAIYIATPHPMHVEWSIKASEAGKHILVEKPIGLNHPEAMAIYDAAARSGVFAMEAFMYRCHPQTQKLKELIQQGAIGDVRQIDSSFGFNMPFDADHRIFNNALGGGAIMDVGCYPMSAARLVAGIAAGHEFADPLKMTALGHLGKTGVDEWASALVSFPGDIQARLATSVSLGLPWSLVVYGREGKVDVLSPWHVGGVEGGVSKMILRSNSGAQEEIDTTDARGLYEIEAEAVSSAILNGQHQCAHMSWDDSLGNMKAIEDWRRKIGLVYEQERPVALTATSKGEPLDHSSIGEMPTGLVKGIDKPASRLVMGCDNQTWMPQASVMFDAFFETGGNCFDTAHLYGNGIMEKLLGDWMNCHGVRDDIVLIGKGAHTPNCRPDAVEPQLIESLVRLRTDYVDLYFFHRDDTNIPVGEFVDAINQQISHGRVAAYGGSNWTLERVVEANAYAANNDLVGFGAVSNQFSLAQMINPVWPGCFSASTPDFVSFLRETETALFGWSSQARGFFTDLSGPDKKDDPELVNAFYSSGNFDRKRRALELAEQYGCTPIQVALAYVLSQPFATFPLIGPRTLVELRSSSRALDFKLSDDEVRYLEIGE